MGGGGVLAFKKVSVAILNAYNMSILPTPRFRGLHLKPLKRKAIYCVLYFENYRRLNPFFATYYRRFLNFVNVFSLFHKYLPLEKGRALHLNKLESPSLRVTCAKFGWNWTSGSGEEDENVKSLQTDRQTEGRTDRRTTNDRWPEKLTWAFSSGELKIVMLT